MTGQAGEPAAAASLLEIDNLSVAIGEGAARTPVIDGLSLSVARGEVVALVGESGSGKSMTALAVMRLLPPGAAITGGTVTLGRDEITAMAPAQLNALRGGRIGMLFQQPQSMLDPTCRIGDQVAEGLRKHRGMGRKEARARAIELLRDVGIPDPVVRARCFSFELSGGMAQRVMIACALSADPDLLIADEPTTALDVTVQAQILRLLDEQRRRRHMAILLITHDLSIVSALAARVAVMYAGRLVEEGPTERVLNAPRHPYTRALVHCSLLQKDGSGALAAIPGGAASARDITCGCRFHPRCAVAGQMGLDHACCADEPALASFADGGKARCWAAPAATEAQR